MMWGFGWNGMGSVWMIIGSLFWLAVLGVLIWALVRWLGARTQASTTPSTRNNQSALDILRERYARGEIDATTFAQMRERLEAIDTVANAPHDQRAPTTL
jgi:putative membrane protein